MLHQTIELSAGRVQPSAAGWRETVERRSKIQCGKRFLAGAILALMAANPSLSKTQAAGLACAAIAEAVADSSRPANDTARDVNRKPLETLAFAGVRPGRQNRRLCRLGPMNTHLARFTKALAKLHAHFG
jgi:hypothetical protein